MNNTQDVQRVKDLLARLQRIQHVNRFAAQKIESNITNDQTHQLVQLHRRRVLLQARVGHLRLEAEKTRQKYDEAERQVTSARDRKARLLSASAVESRSLELASRSLRLAAGVELLSLEERLRASNARLQELVGQRIDELLSWIPFFGENRLIHPPGSPAPSLCLVFTLGRISILEEDANPLDDAMLSSVLGLVVHLMVLICNWFDIVLPHQMKYHSSRSLIFRASDGTGPFPLFRETDSSFDWGFRLLADNVRALSTFAGYQSTDGRAKKLPESVTRPALCALLADFLSSLLYLRTRFIQTAL